MLRPPTLDLTSYGPTLGDTAYWLPYAEAALRQAGLATESMTTGFPGTYPTLVGSTTVVKLFGVFPGWRGSFEAERGVNEVVSSARIAAPHLLAHGFLYPDRDDSWPYLVFETLPGTAWRDAVPTDDVALSVASALGQVLRQVHALPPPGVAVKEGAWFLHARDRVLDRLRRAGTLPQQLLDQVPAFLADYRPATGMLVHADVTEDHVFVDGGRLTGIIDWGDAMVCDPLYDLAALHLGTFGGRRDLLTAFLDAYGWDVTPNFPRRCLQVALLHRFDVLGAVSDTVAEAATLDDLAERLWTPIDRRLS